VGISKKITIMRKKILFTMSAGLLFLSSCKTYYISLDSFKKQFAGMDSTKLKDVVVAGPNLMLARLHYKANPIEVIECADKNETPAQLNNSPSIEMRVTYGHKNKRLVFYFDRVLVINNKLVGGQSRYVENLIRKIPLDSITKIEVQDGHKKFSYISK
jgi:hypothetical protein